MAFKIDGEYKKFLIIRIYNLMNIINKYIYRYHNKVGTMWNRIASNRILDKKRKEEAQRKHLENLRNIKSQVNNSTPRQYLFL